MSTGKWRGRVHGAVPAILARRCRRRDRCVDSPSHGSGHLIRTSGPRGRERHGHAGGGSQRRRARAGSSSSCPVRRHVRPAECKARDRPRIWTARSKRGLASQVSRQVRSARSRPIRTSPRFPISPVTRRFPGSRISRASPATSPSRASRGRIARERSCATSSRARDEQGVRVQDGARARVLPRAPAAPTARSGSPIRTTAREALLRHGAGSPGSYDFLTTVSRYCNQLGWENYANDHEDANGQFEQNFTYNDALVSCDRAIFFRYMVHTLAEQNGMVATFMPKPFTTSPATGVTSTCRSGATASTCSSTSPTRGASACRHWPTASSGV